MGHNILVLVADSPVLSSVVGLVALVVSVFIVRKVYKSRQGTSV